tara:strand:- start:1879 stop:3195 length:1317 start_codon:yes stop_codon:yes gene_type:complete
MRTFRQLRESSARIAVITFGRFNPPTIGHEKMINRITAVAKRYGGDAYVFAGGSQDAKKNPLPYDEKMKLMKKMFPVRGYNIFKYAAAKVPTVMHAASELFKDGYEELIMVVGSDRVKQFQKLLPEYNGVENKPHGFYDFGKITVESAGERDPDADGAEGMSASKMREYVVMGDYPAFEAGMPATLSDRDKRSAYASLRKHMRLKVMENLLRKEKHTDPMLEKHEKVIQIDGMVEYLYNLPYQSMEKIYIDKASSHIDDLVLEKNYYRAKQHVNKIKGYVKILDEQSGMIDYSIFDLKVFDDLLDQYEKPEFVLKPLNERLKQTTTVKEAEFERAVGALAVGLAGKYIWDKFIKQKFSIKAKIEALEDKIKSLRDKKSRIDDPKRREGLADQIAKVEMDLDREREKVADLNDKIKDSKEKHKKKKETEKSNKEAEKEN